MEAGFELFLWIHSGDRSKSHSPNQSEWGPQPTQPILESWTQRIFFWGESCSKNGPMNVTWGWDVKEFLQIIWVLIQKYGKTHQIIPFSIGVSIVNHPFWGPTPIFGNIHIRYFFEHVPSQTITDTWFNLQVREQMSVWTRFSAGTFTFMPNIADPGFIAMSDKSALSCQGRSCYNVFSLLIFLGLFHRFFISWLLHQVMNSDHSLLLGGERIPTLSCQN